MSSDCCSHQFIYDGDSGENLCCLCGIVDTPSYLKKTENAVDTLIQQPNGHPRPDEIVPRMTAVDFSCGGFLSTKMDIRNKDFVGKSVNSAFFNRIRVLNNYVLSSTQMGTFKHAIWNVSTLCDKLVLPSHIAERAAEIFKRVYSHRSNIHNSKSIVCGCIYYACKEAHINRNLPDIATAANEQKSYTSDIFKSYQTIVEFLKLEAPKNLRVIEEISYLGSRVGVAEKTIRKACDIYSLVRKQKGRDRIFFAGKVPRITGAALISMASKYNGSKDSLDISRLCHYADIPKDTLNRRVESYQAYISSLLENDFIESYNRQITEIYKPYFI